MMKKIFLAGAMALSVSAVAQVDFGSTRFGILAGGNYSRVRNAHNPSGPRFAFQAGALGLIPVGSDNQFYLQPEVLYHSAGETGKHKDSKNKPGYDAVYANNYISVPIYFKGYFSEAESEFFAQAGPKFNFLIGQKNKNLAKPWYSEDSYGKANSLNMAVALGVGYSYLRKYELTLKYDVGVSNTYPDLADSPDRVFGDEKLQRKKTEHVVSLSLSYIFD